MAKDRAFYLFFTVILLLALFLRFYDLTERPIHHDEGVIGWFRLNIYNGCTSPKALSSLFNQDPYAKTCAASYTYDPDYHGPFPLLTGAWVYTFFGISDYTLRAPGCLFNALTILLLIFLRKELSDAGTLIAAALLAVSPSMVYYSQFSYPDDFLIFFTLAAVVLAAKYLHDRKDIWLYLASADLAILISIKESSFLFLVSAASFAVIMCFLHFLKKKKKHKKPNFSNLRIRPIIYSVLIFVLVYVFFYSNMFTNPAGLLKGINGGIAFWLNRGTTWTGHFKPFDYYINLLWQYEPAIVILSVASLFCLRTAFSRWCAWWAASTLLIYSFIPYKTPWLDINFILPMALLSGTFAEYCMTRLQGWKKYIPALVILPLLLYSLITAWNVTYVHYADPGNGLAYVTTPDSYNVMLQDIRDATLRFSGNRTPIALRVADYWPLPWSLRGYNLQYGGGQTNAPIVVSDKSDYSDIALQTRDRYLAPVKYEMRQWTYVYMYAWKENYTGTH